ncbi:hypothetical protein [Sphingosinithalassobacter sp. CS137]|uniref:hypothetical protein n=1 Tax=Sphingosinithalassobacter sp. CS137 TaxID=2762748 RepID=UPI00165EA9C6|nr:hypothetical protein [Sphingosinithalassobacter sp. CS137]
MGSMRRFATLLEHLAEDERAAVPVAPCDCDTGNAKAEPAPAPVARSGRKPRGGPMSGAGGA